MSEELQTTQDGPAQEAEVGILARQMAKVYRDMVEYHRRHLKRTFADADAKAREPVEGEYLQDMLHGPPDQVAWWGLNSLEEREAGLGQQRWETIRQAAREELQTGHRSAEAVETTGSTPWDRAQYLALREDLARLWQPQGGIEQTLIDQMAQAQTLYLHWLKIMTCWSQTRCEYGSLSRRKGGQVEWRPPMITEAQSMEMAAGMVDRFQRLFVRAQRALQNMRRYAPVIVQNAGQVNVGAQQVNVAQSGTAVQENPLTLEADVR